MISSLLLWISSGNLGKSSAASTSNDGMTSPFSFIYASNFSVSFAIFCESETMLAVAETGGCALPVAIPEVCSNVLSEF